MDDIFARYVGDGRFIFGVPARDLSRPDFDALTDDQKANVLASGLYELTEKPQQAKKKAEVNKEQSQ